MLDKNKYKDDITKIAMEGGVLAVSKVDNSLVSCDSIGCGDCKFYDFDECNAARREWLNSEYEKPKRVFTKKQKNIIRVLDKIKYIARDMDGDLWGYENKPYKTDFYWKTDSGSCDLGNLTYVDFPQIKWEDDEPTSREEILGE